MVQEEMGRRMRRYFLERVKNEYNAHYIALGHHADDQQETFFIRLIRGTTISGLYRNESQNNSYIRPLLKTTKAEIINYLDTHQIPYLSILLTPMSNFCETVYEKILFLHYLNAIIALKII